MIKDLKLKHAKACTRKRRYATHGEAAADLRALLNRSDSVSDGLRVYECKAPDCRGGFHIGHYSGGRRWAR